MIKKLHQVLNSTQYAIAKGVSDGLTNAQIGAMHSMSAQVVSNHISQIYVKAGVDNRVKLALLFCSEGGDTNLVDLLTPKQYAIALGVAEGLTNAEIAAVEKMSPQVVSNFISQIYNRVSVSDRVSLARLVKGSLTTKRVRRRETA